MHLGAQVSDMGYRKSSEFWGPGSPKYNNKIEDTLDLIYQGKANTGDQVIMY